LPDFHLVETATISPTMCFLCAGHEGPFVDTGVENPQIGRIYICASRGNRVGCVRQMGRLDGLYEPYSNDEINAKLERALDEALPAMNRIMEENLAEALSQTERLTELVTELAKSKLVPALEVFELGRSEK
jgi:hypothetical protein